MRLGLAGWVSLLVVVLPSICSEEAMGGDPTTFDFNYFESLPRKEIVSAAQTYLNSRFPAGSDLQVLQKELVSLARDARGESGGAACTTNAITKDGLECHWSQLNGR